MANFCHPAVRGYPECAAKMSTDALKGLLFDHYASLGKGMRTIPHYRAWRRCMIVELLKRDELAVDPGFKRAERSKHE